MGLVENAKDGCRGRGRPQVRPDAETLALIVDAAGDEFRANGYAGASMCAVAQRAGVSTKTLYRLAPGKSELFRSIVDKRIGEFMVEIDEKALESQGLEAALESLLFAIGRLTLDPKTIALFRLVISESERFPEIGRTFYEAAIRLVNERLERWLAAQRRKGLIDIDDPHLGAEFLRGAMILDPQRGVMLGQLAPPTEAEIAARAKACAKLFLRGWAKARE
ncbi:TetR/AcrR family transcriptional regulator [Rhodoblastus sp.]|jgi:AcrR family transcriptional regulator|uniref:TetR/AcrR family transcriptional regulator n=1 Tax=Rhodoblastus sp. TaxID=1962975 RepID=UPI00261A3CAB|nr:TetR/AcrR family transcriptional regulator [Rhodoblastus sp.]